MSLAARLRNFFSARANTKNLATVYLGLGSNVGDRRYHLESAIEQLKKYGTITLISPWYETEPIPFSNQRWHFNLVLKLLTSYSPREVLTQILSIEAALGRDRGEPNAQRTIDIDILVYEDQIINEPDLIVPHPRLHERAFVLKPLSDIAHSFTHPVLKKTPWELLSVLSTQPIKRIYLPDNIVNDL